LPLRLLSHTRKTTETSDSEPTIADFWANVVLTATVLMATAGNSPTVTTVFLNTENRKLLHDPESGGLLLPAFLGSYENYVCGVPQDRPPKDHTQASYKTTIPSNAPTIDMISKPDTAKAIARNSGAKGAPKVNDINMAISAPTAR